MPARRVYSSRSAGDALGARTPSWRASQGSGAAASCSPRARARSSRAAASSRATAGAPAGVRCAQVTSCPASRGRSSCSRRWCSTLEMDLARSIGAAVGDFQVLAERLAESRMLVGEPAAVGLDKHPAERRVGGSLVGAGLPEKACLARTWSVPA